jgi:hypothetical protein
MLRHDLPPFRITGFFSLEVCIRCSHLALMRSQRGVGAAFSQVIIAFLPSRLFSAKDFESHP